MFEACKSVIGKAVRDSGFSADELDGLILVGGSSQMPILQNFLSNSLNIPVIQKKNIDEIVAFGLGKYIGIKQREEEIKDLVVTDICPFSLSTSTYNEQNPNKDLARVIIPKNSVLPSSKTVHLQTVHKGQTKVAINVYQGQAMYAKDNLFLGGTEISVPRNLMENEAFDLTYSYDINSMLYVEAYVRSTKQKHVFKVGKGDKLEKIDASVRLDRIKEASMQIYQSNEVEFLLTRIERIYEEVDENTQDYLRHLHGHFAEDMKQMNNNIQKRNILIDRVKRILDDIEYRQDVDQLDIFSNDDEESGGFLA